MSSLVRTPVYFLVPSIVMVTILGTYALRNSMLVAISALTGLLPHWLEWRGVARPSGQGERYQRQ